MPTHDIVLLVGLGLVAVAALLVARSQGPPGSFRATSIGVGIGLTLAALYVAARGLLSDSGARARKAVKRPLPPPPPPPPPPDPGQLPPSLDKRIKDAAVDDVPDAELRGPSDDFEQRSERARQALRKRRPDSR